MLEKYCEWCYMNCVQKQFLASLERLVFSVQDECVLMFSLKDEVCRGYVLVKCSDRVVFFFM